MIISFRKYTKNSGLGIKGDFFICSFLPDLRFFMHLSIIY